MSAAKQYRKKPVVIEAVQLRWENWNEVCDLLEGRMAGDGGSARGVRVHADGSWSDGTPGGDERLGLIIPTLEGVLLAIEDDWIIRGVAGEYYPCKPDIFDATYEAV
jgi:hypothetical protein